MPITTRSHKNAEREGNVQEVQRDPPTLVPAGTIDPTPAAEESSPTLTSTSDTATIVPLSTDQNSTAMTTVDSATVRQQNTAPATSMLPAHDERYPGHMQLTARSTRPDRSARSRSSAKSRKIEMLRMKVEIAKRAKELAEAEALLLEAEESASEGERESFDGSSRVEEWLQSQQSVTVQPHRREKTLPLEEQRGLTHVTIDQQPPILPTIPEQDGDRTEGRAPPASGTILDSALRNTASIDFPANTGPLQNAVGQNVSAERKITAPTPGLIDVDTLAAALSRASTTQVREPRKYLLELPYFNGASSDWLTFRAAYRETERLFSRTENVARIRRSLRGPAKEAVQSLLLSEPEPADVLTTLERRFGRQDSLVLAELEKIKQLHKMTEVPKEMCIFANRVANIVATVKAVGKTHYLHAPDMVRILLEKFTPTMRWRWYDFAARQKDNDRPALVQIADFLNEEADKCGAYAAPEIIAEEQASGARRRPAPNERTKTEERVYAAQPLKKPEKEQQCPLCSGDHRLPSCDKFKNSTTDERWKIAVDSRACFRCLKSGHRRPSCREKPCGVNGCTMKHHRLLHNDNTHPEVQKEEQIAATTVLAATGTPRKVFLKIIPVTLTGPKTTLNTFALLDEGSTVTMVDSTIADLLGIEGTPDPLRVQGLGGGRVDAAESKRVNLRIRGQHTTEEHDLVGAHTIEHLKFPPQTISYTTIEECRHLDDVRDTLVYENATPLLLIGQDNWHLIVSREIKSGARHQPVASRTCLGWVLHGYKGTTAKPIHFCSHAVKGDNIDDMLKQYFELESLRIEPRKPKSDPEQRAIEILDATSHRLPDGRFETELLWHHDNAQMSTNYESTLSRLKNLGKKQNEKHSPRENRKEDIPDTGEERVNIVIEETPVSHLPSIERFSSWLRLIRTMARVLQFVELCRPHSQVTAAGRHKRTRSQKSPVRVKTNPKKENSTTGRQREYRPLRAQHLIAAEELWIKISQKQAFEKEIQRVKKNVSPAGDDRLARFALIIDEKGILRLKSRIAIAKDIQDDQLYPAVLDGGHPYVQLYIHHVHKQLHHGGTELVVNELRQRAWIIRLRPSVRNVIRRCHACRIRKTPVTSPPTGDHPAARLAHHQRPYTFVGLDYFGPVEVTVGRRHEKRYVALFTCLTTRALHLEIAGSLRIDSAISALRRMIARRGCPKVIWSDNGTNFRAAEELRGAFRGLQEEASNRQIDWKFIPPGAPFMGGAWERLVRSTKEALRTVLHEKYPHEETLATLLAEVENTVNSRPLTHVALSSEDEVALTPNHILLGTGNHIPPPGKFDENDVTAKQLWRRAQYLADEFWKRWIKEYLPELQNRREPRGRGESPTVGDVVLIADPNLPRNTWPRGIIHTVYPGADGVVRVVDVKTTAGIFRRPTKKIVVLQINTNNEEQVCVQTSDH